MARQVHAFREVESVSVVVQVLRGVTHNGFPVVQPDADEEYHLLFNEPVHHGTFQGIVLRSQVLVLLQVLLVVCLPLATLWYLRPKWQETVL